uniref:Threonylcarbamoyl-AMP synthase n=1 Tax=Lepisosteus oculatus TaxID=7918 RepID=W5ND28_LEPOC
MAQGFAAVFYSEPAVLGLLANVFSAFYVALQNFAHVATHREAEGVENTLAATANYVMPVVFGAITVTLAFEAVGLVAEWALAVSGAAQLVIVACGFYGAAALLLKGLYQRHVLPGFGNALFDVLLLGAKIKPAQRKMVGRGEEEEEKKKNSKYAEPLALGNMSDTVSAAILAFHCFGYPRSFQVGTLWVSINCVAQLLASYYAYLRLDVFHGTKFAFHSAYWLVQSWEEFVVTVPLAGQDVGDSRAAMLGGWFFLAAALLLCLLSLSRDRVELLHNATFAGLTVSTLPQIRGQGRYAFFGVVCVLYAVLSLGISFVSLVNSIAEKALIPLGARLVSPLKLQEALFGFKRCLTPYARPLPPPSPVEELRAQLSDALFFFCNGLAALSALQFSGPDLARSRPLLRITEPSLHAFTAGAVAFLIINAFIIITGVFLAIFTVLCVYGATASFANYLFEKPLIPMGPQLMKSGKSKKTSAEALPCPCPSSQKTSGLMTIARILESGGVCGIPSDTVYTLSASCKHPSAIERIYNIKERPLEKPICLTIASLAQLEEVNPPFSPLLWEFMRNIYPGGIGCIVRKGDWLRKLGVGPAYDYVGTKDTIMIRISDLTVTTHLLSMTGPLAITSANPSGEPDSTHHDMVVTRLGHKLDGVLCDGDSTELVSSTVVICTKIDEGTAPCWAPPLFSSL